MEQRMRKTGWTKKAVLFLILGCLMLGGCTFVKKETVKLRDLDFTVLSEEKIPEELKKKIEEVKRSHFSSPLRRRTDCTYVSGTGSRKEAGYSIAVNALYLTDGDIRVNTSLLGSETPKRENEAPSCPYIVLKTELLKQPVTFE